VDPRKECEATERSLTRAFLTFTQAAGSLEKSYTQLQAEVGRLRAELERANTELSQSLEENSRVRAFLARVLEGLPCGVMVTDAGSPPRMINPEARRLLHLEQSWEPSSDAPLPAGLAELLVKASASSFFS
jgi:nitrogen fixation/metabolism regulation signal transduction histidine kinase